MGWKGRLLQQKRKRRKPKGKSRTTIKTYTKTIQKCKVRPTSFPWLVITQISNKKEGKELKNESLGPLHFDSRFSKLGVVNLSGMMDK